MPEGLLKPVIVGLSTLIAFAVMFLMAKLVGGGMKKEEGQTLLSHGGFVRGLGVLCGIIAIASLLGFVVDLFTGWMGPKKGDVGLLILAGGSALFGIPLLLEGYRRIALTEEGLINHGVFGTDPLIRWEEITSIVDTGEKFVVRTARHRISLSHWLDGLDLFIAECKKRLTPEIYGDIFGKD